MPTKLKTDSPLAVVFNAIPPSRVRTEAQKAGSIEKNNAKLAAAQADGSSSIKYKKTPPKMPAYDRKKENIKLAAITMIQAQLAQYDKIIIKDPEQLRTYVTNKLIEVSQCGAVKEELRALELLGKMSDVGLFTDKTEIKVSHTNSGALEETIKEKIGRLIALKKQEIEEPDEDDIDDVEYEDLGDEESDEGDD
jgi:hypothetical protein